MAKEKREKAPSDASGDETGQHDGRARAALARRDDGARA